MAKRNQSRWQDLDHSAEPLLQHIVLRASTRTTGPIPEFLAKKAAEREPKTLEWYRDSLTQLWAFLEEHDLVLVGDLNEHNVNAFRVYVAFLAVNVNPEGSIAAPTEKWGMQDLRNWHFLTGTREQLQGMPTTWSHGEDQSGISPTRSSTRPVCT